MKRDEGRLLVSKQNLSTKQADLGHSEVLVNDKTRVWKGDKEVKLADLAVGDELLVNLTGVFAQSPRRCSDIWAGLETHKLATAQQRTNHNKFLQARGLTRSKARPSPSRFFAQLTALLNGDPLGKKRERHPR